MPTTRRRHTITETPPVQAVLDGLRRETGSERLDIAELVILGAREKLARLQRDDAEKRRLRRELADMIRRGDIPVDPDAAEWVRRHGWTPHV